MVTGPLALVDFERGGIKGVQRIQSDAALKTGSGRLAQQAQHLDFLHQVVGALEDVRVAMHPLAGKMADRGHHLPVFGLVSQFVGLGHGVDVRRDRRMIDQAVHALASDVRANFQLAQAIDILLGCFQCHVRSPRGSIRILSERCYRCE